MKLYQASIVAGADKTKPKTSPEKRGEKNKKQLYCTVIYLSEQKGSWNPVDLSPVQG